MNNNGNANSEDKDNPVSLNEGAMVLIDESGINYNESKNEDKSLVSTVKIKFKFFISHASISQKINDKSTPPLEGEEEFVKSLVDNLEKYSPKSTYVDYGDNPNFEFSIFHTALKSSEYGIFVCSPRFNYRYINNLSAFITEEVKHFWTIKNTHHQPYRLLPIRFGQSILDYDSGPFSSSDFMIDAEYGKLSIEQMIKKVISEIVRKVGS